MENSFNAENAKAQMRKGLLEFCTLLIIAKGKTYASDILKSLKTADLLVVEGTLYPLLSRLKTSGLLAYNWEESKTGPPRKYYTLTPEGHNSLAEWKKTWTDFSNSINSLINLQSHEKNN